MSKLSLEAPLNENWLIIRNELKKLFGKKPDLNTILFLIGVQELGQGQKEFTKEEKQDLLHIATCKVLSFSGYYELEGIDQDGWPHWKSLKELPYLKVKDQETFLKEHIVLYFRDEVWKDA